MAGWGPVDRASQRPLAAESSAPPPARSPEPPPSAWLPLTDPASPAVSPIFAADRLRTTFAPRIGQPDLYVCRLPVHKARQHTHPSFPPQRSPLLGSTERPRPYSRVTKRVRTYNHLLGARHGAFATKPARSSRRTLPRRLLSHDRVRLGAIR